MRILTKLISFALVPSVLGVCLVAFFDFLSAERTLKEQLTGELHQLAQGQQIALGNIIGMMNEAIGTLADAANVQSLVAAAAQGASHQAIDKYLALVQSDMVIFSRNFVRIKNTGIISSKGIVLAHSDKGFVGSSLSEREYFQKAMSGKETSMTIISKVTGALSTTLAKPVFVDGNVMGVVYCTIDLKVLAKGTVSTVAVGGTGQCFVFDSKGLVLMHNSDELIGKDLSSFSWVQEMLSKDNSFLSYYRDGNEYFAFSQRMPSLGWTIVVSVMADDILAPVQSMLRQSMLSALAIAIVVGLLIFFVARGYSRILTDGAAFVRYVAGGHFHLNEEQKRTLERDSRRGDEIGELAAGIRDMTMNLAQLFDQSEKKTQEAQLAVAEAEKASAEAQVARQAAESARRDGMLSAAKQLEGIVEIITSASTQLSAQIEHSERGATEQASRVAETATAMEEMTSTVLEVARNANVAASVSGETREKALKGQDVVHQAVKSIQSVQTDSIALKTDMSLLVQHAEDISKIMNVISDIADQTNLLALNAAIEAARAGDAGRGFAVVADEVRKLAEKTMVSTTDVGNAIRAIQQSTASSMVQVDHAVTDIEKATNLATQSGEALTEIVKLVGSSADQVNSIASAAEEQSAASEEINLAITKIAGIASETARAMSESTLAVSELARQSQELRRLIDALKRA